MELAVELPSPPQFLPVPQEVYFKPIPFGQPPASVPSFSHAEFDEELHGLVTADSSSRAALSASTIHTEPQVRPISGVRPVMAAPSNPPSILPTTPVASNVSGPIIREPSVASVASGALSSPTKRIEKPKAQLPALKKFKEEKVLVRYASANALIPKGTPLPLTSAHYLSILRDTSKRMATQRDWNVDEPVKKLEKLSINAESRPSPREELEDALGTDKFDSEIEQALSSRGPLPEQLISSRRRARAPDPISMLRGETAAEPVPAAPTSSSVPSSAAPVTAAPTAPLNRVGLSQSAIEGSSSMPEVPRLRLEKLHTGGLSPSGPLSRLSNDSCSPLSPDRSKYIVNLVSPRTAFAPMRKPSASQLAQGTTARELMPSLSPVGTSSVPSASSSSSSIASLARPQAPLPRP